MEKGHVSKEDLLKFIAGHTQANKLLEKERKKRLQHLSSEESFVEYQELCGFWEQITSKEISEQLEMQKISSLVRRRELLNRGAGKIKG